MLPSIGNNFAEFLRGATLSQHANVENTRDIVLRAVSPHVRRYFGTRVCTRSGHATTVSLLIALLSRSSSAQLLSIMVHHAGRKIENVTRYACHAARDTSRTIRVGHPETRPRERRQVKVLGSPHSISDLRFYARIDEAERLLIKRPR